MKFKCRYCGRQISYRSATGKAYVQCWRCSKAGWYDMPKEVKIEFGNINSKLDEMSAKMKEIDWEQMKKLMIDKLMDAYGRTRIELKHELEEVWTVEGYALQLRCSCGQWGVDVSHEVIIMEGTQLLDAWREKWKEHFTLRGRFAPIPSQFGHGTSLRSKIYIEMPESPEDKAMKVALASQELSDEELFDRVEREEMQVEEEEW